MTVSVSPTWALPEIDGGVVARGAALPEIASVAFELAVVEPSSFFAVTWTRTVLPVSASVSLYLVVVAPEMSPHDEPSLSHRCHWYVYVVGLPDHSPRSGRQLLADHGLAVDRRGSLVLRRRRECAGGDHAGNNK